MTYPVLVAETVFVELFRERLFDENVGLVRDFIRTLLLTWCIRINCNETGQYKQRQHFYSSGEIVMNIESRISGFY